MPVDGPRDKWPGFSPGGRAAPGLLFSSPPCPQSGRGLSPRLPTGIKPAWQLRLEQLSPCFPQPVIHTTGKGLMLARSHPDRSPDRIRSCPQGVRIDPTRTGGLSPSYPQDLDHVSTGYPDHPQPPVPSMGTSCPQRGDRPGTTQVRT